ncbi:hypothetical protein A1332_04815 [Methylomonas methanica]|jgi:hypothetical protein|uniref:Uncharacterized protein n=1 Tax=Methylomonas methanica TaxID=421 RepID=A0A177LUX4_METMH|nr:hypothetical protein A1332_04815 [Methylomonas methanica]
MICIAIRVAVNDGRVVAKRELSSIFQNISFLEIAMKKLSHLKGKAMTFSHQVEGRVLPPLILWMLGVPGGICVILWFFFFRD